MTTGSNAAEAARLEAARLEAENSELRSQLDEARQALDAIRRGEVDAVVVERPDGPKVYTLAGADEPYRVMVEEMQEGAVTLRADGLIVYGNRQIARMLRTSHQALLGKPFRDFLAPESLPVFDALLRGCGSGARGEVVLCAGDGARVPALLAFRPLSAGPESLISLVVADLSELKRLQEIAASEAFSAAVFDQAGDALVVCDERGRVLRANQAAHRLCGANPLFQPFDAAFPLRRAVEPGAGDAPGGPSAEPLALFPLAARAPFPRGLEAALACAGGPPRDLLVNVGALLDASGRPLGCIVAMLDLTERNRMEEAVRRSEAILRAITDGTEDAIYVKDSHSRLLFVNPATLRVVGKPAEQIVGHTDAEFYDDPAIGAAILENDRRLMDRGESEAFEETVDTPAGRRILLSSKVPWRDGEGRVIGLIGISSDITERKRREEQIAKLTRLYAVLSQVNEAIVRVRDAESLFREVCRIVAENGGFPLVWIGRVQHEQVLPVASCGPAAEYLKEICVEVRGELGRGPTGTCIRENRAVVNDDFAVNPAAAPWRERALRHGFRASAAFPLRRQGTPVGSLTLYTCDPNAFDAEQVALLESLIADLSYALDALEQEQLRARAEERTRLLSEVTAQLLASSQPQRIVEALCRRVMEHLGCHVFFNFLVDDQRHCLRLNACAGISEEAARQLEWLDYGGSVCGCVARDGSRIVAEHIQSTPDARTELVRSYGVQAYACHPLMDQGRVIGTLSFGSRARPAFADDELELMKTVADHVAIAMQRIRMLESLERHARAAEAANAAKSQFLANMSHELRTPMNAILGMIDVALPKATDPTVQDCLQTAKGSADLLLTLLDGVLDTAKIEAGRLELEAAPFSLRRVLDQTTQVLSVRASEKGIAFSCRIPPDVPDALVGDRMRLRQVLFNLGGNAVKFTHRGEVEIRVRVPEEAEIEASKAEACAMSHWRWESGHGPGTGGQGPGTRGEAQAAQQQSLIPNLQSPQPPVTLLFAVRDTGIGIAPSELENIFRPFAQADASTTRTFGGTGLGLTISASLVGMMGGRIWVESQPGQGSTFYFTVRLPLADTPPAELQLPHVLESASRALRILLVEDNPANQKLAAYVLGDRGHTVDIAAEGEQAIRIAAEHRHDVILMDVQMPGMDGLQATAAIRRREAEDAQGLAEWGWERGEGRGTRDEGPGVPDEPPVPSVLSPVASRRVPIIAMTAHAMKGDRERCLAAGMDGYLSKPVNGRDMIALVESLAAKSPGAGEAAQAPPGEPEPPSPPAAVVFDPEEALTRCFNSRKMVHDMIRCFFDEEQSLFPEMRAALAQGDLAEVGRLGHRMKGTVVYLGAAPAVDAAQRVERFCTSSDGAASEAEEAIDALERACRALRAALAEHPLSACPAPCD